MMTTTRSMLQAWQHNSFDFYTFLNSAIARQPEASGDIRTTMIIAAALVEGAALFAIVVALGAAG